MGTDTGNLLVRVAEPGDVAAMHDIYTYYVRTSAVTFDGVDEAPSPSAFAEKVARTLETYPWLAAERDGKVVGFAYAGPLRKRSAYDWSVETTIYLHRDARKAGAGRALYTELERLLKLQGVRSLYACIAFTEREHDENLSDASPRFHERMGFEQVGEFADCGFKFGKWYGITWMRKDIAPHDGAPEPLVPFAQVRG